MSSSVFTFLGNPRCCCGTTLHLCAGQPECSGRDWGLSIYGQADPQTAPVALTMAYDRGARYLWFWSSDHGHHLPFEEQLELAAVVRDHALVHYRGDRQELLSVARDAIVLPYGYTFEISDWQKRGLSISGTAMLFPSMVAGMSEVCPIGLSSPLPHGRWNSSSPGAVSLILLSICHSCQRQPIDARTMPVSLPSATAIETHGGARQEYRC